MNETITQNSPRAWLLAARPKTLTGAITPVIIALALAARDLHFHLNPLPAILCILFALIMQIDANFINDYFDFRRGHDDPASRLGPPRACPMGWVTPRAMQIAIALTTVLACLIGLPLVVYGGYTMLIIGAACVVFCFLYTTFLASHALGDVLVVVFFGLVPVSATFYLQTATLTQWVVILSITCGLVIDNLLIVNNYRDIDVDRLDHKLTLVVLLGKRFSLSLYFFIGCFATFVVFIYSHFTPQTLPILVYLAFHCHTYSRMKHLEGRDLNISLAHTARNNLIFGICLALVAIL